MKCLILAGGFGTRLYPLTANKAKALLDYNGRPLLSHLIDCIPRDMDVLVSTNKRFEADFNSWQQAAGRQIELCLEEVHKNEHKKGAVSALNHWIKQRGIGEDLLVLAGDNYFGFDLSRFIAAYNGKNMLVAVYDIGDKDKASHFGVVSLNGYRILAIEEKPAVASTSLIATACYILPPRIFPHLDRYCSEGRRDNLGNFISYLLDKDEVHVFTFTEKWFDIGAETADRL
jgi:glucose-1-phosphate thymidylyltransferase